MCLAIDAETTHTAHTQVTKTPIVLYSSCSVLKQITKHVTKYTLPQSMLPHCWNKAELQQFAMHTSLWTPCTIKSASCTRAGVDQGWWYGGYGHKLQPSVAKLYEARRYVTENSYITVYHLVVCLARLGSKTSAVKKRLEWKLGGKDNFIYMHALQLRKCKMAVGGNVIWLYSSQCRSRPNRMLTPTVHCSCDFMHEHKLSG